MLSIEDLESACNASQRVEPAKHMVEPPELPFQATFYPFGFPAVIRTNSEGVLKQYEEMWGKFTKQHDTEPLRAEVQVVESNTTAVSSGADAPLHAAALDVCCRCGQLQHGRSGIVATRRS